MVTTFSIACLGHLGIEISIEPEVPSLGGGSGGGYISPSQTKYLLKIKVSRKNKSWDYEGKISRTTAKVIAKFLGRELPAVEVISSNVISTEQPKVEATHVSTTKIR